MNSLAFMDGPGLSLCWAMDFAHVPCDCSASPQLPSSTMLTLPLGSGCTSILSTSAPQTQRYRTFSGGGTSALEEGAEETTNAYETQHGHLLGLQGAETAQAPN